MNISRNDLFIHDLPLKTLGHYMLIPYCVSLSPETSTGFQKIRGVHEWKGFESWIRSLPTLLLGCLDKRNAVFSLPRARARTSMVMAYGGQLFPAGWLPQRVTSHKGCLGSKEAWVEDLEKWLWVSCLSQSLAGQSSQKHWATLKRLICKNGKAEAEFQHTLG